MLKFDAVIEKFGSQGEKTGWTYIKISKQQAEILHKGVKTSYRVKGNLDAVTIEKQALLPMGDGGFILTLNANLRKKLGKMKGAVVQVGIEVDDQPLGSDADFTACLDDEPLARKHYETLTKGHQNYFTKWLTSAKTETTKTKRIAMAVNALSKGWGFPEMLRAAKQIKENES